MLPADDDNDVACVKVFGDIVFLIVALALALVLGSS
jgi:hypothetical protein